MTTDEQQDINDLANELCYERIKFSPLWDSLKSNGGIDAKARDFAALIQLRLEELIEKAELELEPGVEVDADGDESDREWRGATFNEEAWAATINTGAVEAA